MVNLKDVIAHLPSANPQYPLEVTAHSLRYLKMLLVGTREPTTTAERWLLRQRSNLASTEHLLTLVPPGFKRCTQVEINHLLGSADPPPNTLWRWGEIPPPPYLVVVGPRKPSPYAEALVTRWVARLANHCTVVSGLAYGIDTLALSAALEAGGRAIACVPTGVATIYPRVNQGLASRLVQGGGAVISELLLCQQVTKLHFLLRNRLMAAIADVLWIPEAAQRSGTMTTARLALELHKTITTTPADVTRSTSTGSNQLLSDGAVCSLNESDLAALLGIDEHKIAPVPEKFAPLTSLISQGFDTPDKMVQEIGLTPSELLQRLAGAVSAGVLMTTRDGRYQLAK